jgi:hypothetical protein
LIEIPRKSFRDWNPDHRDRTAPSVPLIQTTIAVRLLFEGLRLFEAIGMPARIICHFSSRFEAFSGKSRGEFLNVCLLYSLAFFPHRPRLNVISVDCPVARREFS